MRKASVTRQTAETDVRIQIDLDGEGRAQVHTGIGFFDHMLTAFARHALIDLTVECEGDLAVDGHHTVEDVGIVLGQCLSQALGGKEGIARVGHSYVPMDEALAFCALDISGRGFLAFSAHFPSPRVGAYDSQLTQEFMRSFSQNGAITLHMTITGENTHHMAEAAYKALGRALRIAAAQDPRVKGVPSTKGTL